MDYQEAEQSYLGCILKDGELIKETALDGDKLYDPSNQAILNAMKEIERKGDPVDIVTVVTKIGPSNLKELGGRNYLSNLMASVPSLERFKVYERYVLEGWKIREAAKIMNVQIGEVSDIEMLKKKLSELETENNDDEYDHQQAIIKLHEKIENQQEGLSGIDTGLEGLNSLLDGFQPGNLIISAARPSVGKSAKMVHHAIKHAMNGGIVAIFSLEMEEDELLKRMISAIGRIDGHKLKNPIRFFNDEDWKNYTYALGELGKMNIIIYDKPGQTVPFIRSKAKNIRKDNPDAELLIQIDYLQLIRSNEKFNSKNDEVGEISRSLKELAKDVHAPVYLLSQLSRGVEQRQDKRPMMSDLRDSGNIEQDADVIELLYRDDYYDAGTEKQNIIEIIVAKHRGGSVGTVEVVYMKQYNLFLDLDTTHAA